MPSLTTPSVLVARDLAPADTALLDASVVAGFITEEGGPTSHTAILARAMNVPAVVACANAMASIREGTLLLVNGTTGVVQVEPDEASVVAAKRAITRRAAALTRSTGFGATADGHPVPLLANIGSAADAAAAVRAGAEGVGLFRTEFVFLDRATAPTEDEQVAGYLDVLASFTGRKVVARVLDAGGDKPLAFLAGGTEPNPALGLRGLRALLSAPDVLATQLRAQARWSELVQWSGEPALYTTCWRPSCGHCPAPGPGLAPNSRSWRPWSPTPRTRARSSRPAGRRV
jgi:phosphotransferase system enzyme I (PtsI)